MHEEGTQTTGIEELKPTKDGNTDVLQLFLRNPDPKTHPFPPFPVSMT